MTHLLTNINAELKDQILNRKQAPADIKEIYCIPFQVNLHFPVQSGFQQNNPD